MNVLWQGLAVATSYREEENHTVKTWAQSEKPLSLGKMK